MWGQSTDFWKPKLKNLKPCMLPARSLPVPLMGLTWQKYEQQNRKVALKDNTCGLQVWEKGETVLTCQGLLNVLYKIEMPLVRVRM